MLNCLFIEIKTNNNIDNKYIGEKKSNPCVDNGMIISHFGGYRFILILFEMLSNTCNLYCHIKKKKITVFQIIGKYITFDPVHPVVLEFFFQMGNIYPPHIL